MRALPPPCAVPFLLSALWVSAGASAQDSDTPTNDPHTLLMPSSAAWADGASALAVNPAGLGYRRPFAAELALGGALPATDLIGLGGYGGAYGLAGGGRVLFSDDGARGQAGLAFGAALPEGLGAGLGVNLLAPGPDVSPYAALTVGLAMRPAPWLALGAAARDIAPVEGHPGRYSPSIDAGVALRPLGYRLTLSADWVYQTAPMADPHTMRVLIEVEPVDGVRVMASIDEDARLGVGLTLAFRPGWIGGQARVETRGAPGVSGWTAGVGTSAASPPTRLVPSRDIARLDLGGTAENPTPSLLAPRRTPTRFADLVQTLADLGEDPSVAGVLLRLDGYRGGMARAEEIRAGIAALKEAGTPVFAYLGAGGDNVEYYIAAACDRVWMHPAATLSLTGLSTRMTFYRGSLDKLGVQAQFSRIGIYKSSPEQYTETAPTAPNLQVRNALLDDRHDRWLTAIAAGRQRDPAAMQALVDDGPYPAGLALEKGLVDALVYPDELRDRAREAAGRPGAGLRRPLEERTASRHWRPPHSIAVIHVDGLINTGRSGRLPLGLLEISGSDTLVDAIERARDDRTIDAIVLRVDSPGGSAFASEEIWRQVALTRGTKPVVVSMASMAASGGYYASCAADHILADPSTLTGSIGVYSGKVSLAGLYDKLGITTIKLRRGEHAGLYDMDEPWSPSEYRAVERVVDHLYADFIGHVAEGRGADDVDAIDRVARGRVWTGAQALEVGLVDELGGLVRAVEVARELAGIPPRAEVRLVHGPRVGPLASLRLGRGFVEEGERWPWPGDLRAALSALMLMEMQREPVPALMLVPVVEEVE